MFAPAWRALKNAVTSINSDTTACAFGWEAVAVEFHCGEAGALRRATSVPFRDATNPSSYFICKVSVLKAAGLATVNGSRMKAEALLLSMRDWTSVAMMLR